MKYRYDGPQNRHTNYTTSLVLESGESVPIGGEAEFSEADVAAFSGDHVLVAVDRAAKARDKELAGTDDEQTAGEEVTS
jgi:hypothetical protein